MVEILAITAIITSILFFIIYYQSINERNLIESKEIENTVNVFISNLSDKLSIITSSNIFMDFLTSGKQTKNEIEPKFLDELFQLKSNGVIGYTLTNTQTRNIYRFGTNSTNYLTVKLCYLTNKLDKSVGSCLGSLKLFFSNESVTNTIKIINKRIKNCTQCKAYNLIQHDRLGNLSITDSNGLSISIMIGSSQGKTIYLYLITLSILLAFALFNKTKIHKIISKRISDPLDTLVKNLNDETTILTSDEALIEIQYLSKQIDESRDKINKINEFEKEAALGHLATSVAHDIRSPLAVMEIMLANISERIPDSKRQILNQAIQSVRDISNNLLEKYRQLKDPNALGNTVKYVSDDYPRFIVMKSHIESIVIQKKQEWDDDSLLIETIITPNSELVWAYISPISFRRLLSNLLNNSFESLQENRFISLVLTSTANLLILEISDKGCGIPKNKIIEVVNGLSLKDSGSGIGLSSAKKYMETIGGKLELFSQQEKGTRVILTFPEFSLPQWYPKAISLRNNQTIVILDDDTNIHNLWRHRLDSFSLKIFHFTNFSDFNVWLYKNRVMNDETIFLIDYDIGENDTNGIKIISDFEVKHNCFLVTNHGEVADIQTYCENLGIWLIPKFFIKDINIVQDT
jgi:signal transduction histidine kinase